MDQLSSTLRIRQASQGVVATRANCFVSPRVFCHESILLELAVGRAEGEGIYLRVS
jgi:hypothetical protein